MKTGAVAVLSLLALVASVGSAPALAFGSKGHRIVATIAQNHLAPGVLARIYKITKNRSLAALSTWPDKIRSYPEWQKSGPWHYLSIDDDVAFAALQRSREGDVLKELSIRERQLRDPALKGVRKWRALAFYIHFMADIHQPLHVGRRDDRGGNDIVVKWFGKKMKLHAIWDRGLIRRENLGFQEYAAALDKVSAAQIKKWQAADYLDYAKESKAMRADIYNFGKQKTGIPRLGRWYDLRNIGKLNRRLLQAGIRLAGKLNDIFAPQAGR